VQGHGCGDWGKRQQGCFGEEEEVREERTSSNEQVGTYSLYISD